MGRSNDVGNFWAMGVLLEDTLTGDPDVTLDLVGGRMEPAIPDSAAAPLAEAWSRYLRWSLAKHGLSVEVVRSATVIVDFDRSVQVGSWIHGGFDNPFEVVVTIRDDHGREYVKRRDGHCGPPSQWQDPNPSNRPRPSAGPGDPGRMDWRLQE